MHCIEIKNETATSEKFFGPDGWGNEPVTKKLGVPGEIIGQIFPSHKDEYSLTAFDDSEPIGHCCNNLWEDFLDQLPKNSLNY